MRNATMGRPVVAASMENVEDVFLVVDASGQQLIGNPAHGGEPMIDLY